MPLKNVAELTTGPSGEDTRKAQFGEPILLDLGGQTIRKIRKNAAGEYLIVSGQSGIFTPSAGDDGAKDDTGSSGPIGPIGLAGPKGDTGPQGSAGPVTVGPNSESAAPTITVDSKGRLVVRVGNASRKAQRVRVVARATIGGKRLTIAARTITVEAGKSSKVTLTVSKPARRKLGKIARPLEVTATPQHGRAATCKAKVARRQQSA